MSEAQFWSAYYASQESKGYVPTKPSSFAEFAWTWLDQENVSGRQLVDLGCGTGRDSRYFAARGFSVVGVDQADSVITELKEKERIRDERYQLGDFAHLGGVAICEGVDVLYSRFSVHSISRKDASDLYQWAGQKGLKSGGLFFIEARSIHDPLYQEGDRVDPLDSDVSVSGHYRRFIRLSDLTDQLRQAGFELLYQAEGCGWSVVGKDDPVLVRVVAKKK